LKSGTGSLGSFNCARKVRLGRGSGAAAFQSVVVRVSAAVATLNNVHRSLEEWDTNEVTC
jgi:hypothetical protein